jgi:hypothetical protein
MEPKVLSVFQLEQSYDDKVNSWTCECYGKECDCDRSCDIRN